MAHEFIPMWIKNSLPFTPPGSFRMCRVATPFYQLPAYHVYSFLRNLLYLIPPPALTFAAHAIRPSNPRSIAKPPAVRHASRAWHTAGGILPPQGLLASAGIMAGKRYRLGNYPEAAALSTAAFPSRRALCIAGAESRFSHQARH